MTIFPGLEDPPLGSGNAARRRGLAAARPRNTLIEVTAVLLCGVPVEDRHVLQIAALVDQRLGSKLVTAYRLRHSVVALSAQEREEVLAALDDPPSGLAELRAVLLAEHAGRGRLA